MNIFFLNKIKNVLCSHLKKLINKYNAAQLALFKLITKILENNEQKRYKKNITYSHKHLITQFFKEQHK